MNNLRISTDVCSEFRLLTAVAARVDRRRVDEAYREQHPYDVLFIIEALLWLAHRPEDPALAADAVGPASGAHAGRVAMRAGVKMKR